MSVYVSRHAAAQPAPAAAPLPAPAQALYDEIAAWSSDMAERLALLGQRGNTGAADPADVQAVRQRLWGDYDPGPPRVRVAIPR